MRAARAKMSRHADAGRARDYMLRRWDAFSRFLGDGRICLSDNAVERALCGTAPGRKAWLFADFNRSGEQAAAMYSLTVTAKLNGVDCLAHAGSWIGGHKSSPWRAGGDPP